MTLMGFRLKLISHIFFVVPELEKRIPLAAQTSYCAELEELQELLHFPEEVALRLADTEYQLFYQVIVLLNGYKLAQAKATERNVQKD